MHKILAPMILGAMLAAAQTPPETQPTAAELLQKGIYAQETAGDLDGAIKIYHQIVDSHPIQREIAAQAQYRLGMTLLAKGDAASASQEIQRLGWDFPDYKDLIASAKNVGGTIQGPIIRFYTSKGLSEAYAADVKEAQANGTAAARDLQKAMVLEADHDAVYDFSKTVTLTGTVAQVEWAEPSAWVTVNPTDGASPVRVSLESVKGRLRGGKDALNIGDQVVVIGAPARDGSSTMQATKVTGNGALKYLRGNTPAK